MEVVDSMIKEAAEVFLKDGRKLIPLDGDAYTANIFSIEETSEIVYRKNPCVPADTGKQN